MDRDVDGLDRRTDTIIDAKKKRGTADDGKVDLFLMEEKAVIANQYLL